MNILATKKRGGSSCRNILEDNNGGAKSAAKLGLGLDFVMIPIKTEQWEVTQAFLSFDIFCSVSLVMAISQLLQDYSHIDNILLFINPLLITTPCS
jgi:hypothetical protein